MDNYEREQHSKKLAEEVKAIVRRKNINHHDPVEVDVSTIPFDDRNIFSGVISYLIGDSRFEFYIISSDYNDLTMTFQRRPNA